MTQNKFNFFLDKGLDNLESCKKWACDKLLSYCGNVTFCSTDYSSQCADYSPLGYLFPVSVLSKKNAS